MKINLKQIYKIVDRLLNLDATKLHTSSCC